VKSAPASDNMLIALQEETTDEEKRVDRAVLRAIEPIAGDLQLIWCSTLFHRDLSFLKCETKLLESFKVSQGLCEQNIMKIRQCESCPVVGDLSSLPKQLETADSKVPSLTTLGFSEEEVENACITDPHGVLSFEGGETAGLDRVRHFIWAVDGISNCINNIDGMKEVMARDSSKLSAFLAHGCISPRYLYAEIQVR